MGRTAESQIFSELWSKIIQECLREFVYMAEMASLKTQFIRFYDNFQIKWKGYNDSLLVYV